MRDCKRVRSASAAAIIAGPIQDSFFVPGTYYVTIRATDAANNVIYSTSSGVTVDITAPAQVKAVFHADPDYDPKNPEAVSFMANNRSMLLGWDFEDLESSVSGYEYCVGRTNTTCDMINWTSSGKDDLDNLLTQVTVSVPMQHGHSYFAQVRAYNRAGLNVTVSSSGVTIDQTPPVAGVLKFVDKPVDSVDGVLMFSDPTTMAVNWTAFLDPESGIAGYDWSIGLSPSTAEVLPWTPVGVAGSSSVRVKDQFVYADANMVRSDRPWESPNTTISVLQDAPFRLEPGIVYYNNLRGWNNALLSTELTSVPFMIKRPQDQLLKSVARGDFMLLSLAFGRRAVLDLSQTSVAVNVPEGAIGNNTLLNLIPLSETDYTASYTFGTGRQLDVFSREFYNVTQHTYIRDPNITVTDARQKLLFTGISFAVSPVAVENSTVSLSPLSVRAQIPSSWNRTAYHPSWMYWHVATQTWDRVAPLCGPLQVDTVTNLSLPFVNISAPICDPFHPVLPDCPTTQSCQTINSMADENIPCVFPFRYNGTVYSACTTQHSPTGQPWCGTVTNVTGTSDWGFCNCNATGYCLTQGTMALRGSSCVFPFSLNGVNYSTCAPGLGGKSWCATQSTYSDGNWGTCACFNASYGPGTCLPAGTPRPDPSGPSAPVQFALMLVASDTSCAAPVVPDILAGPFTQGWSRDVVLRLNSTLPFGDPITYVIDRLPAHGSLDVSRLGSGIVKYRLGAESQYFYGNETFAYASQQTGLTALGQISPCVPLQSNDGTVVITITNVNDAPLMVLDVFSQPSDYLRAKYLNNSDARFSFEITMPEDTTFNATILVQDHDLDDTFDFVLLQGPTLNPTPAWVQRLATPFAAGTTLHANTNRHPWTQFGVETQMNVFYTPSANLNGLDVVRFTVVDRPGVGMTPLLASTAPFEFRFTLTAVNDVPVALTQNLIVDSTTGRQGLPYYGQLQYYDVETPPSNLTLRFPSRPAFFDQYNLTVVPDNETYSVLTAAGGRVTLLPTNETGDQVWVRFVYVPPGGAYTGQDSFQYVVSDGNATSLASVVTLSYPQGSSGGLAPAVMAAIAILVIVALATFLALLILHRRRTRQRKVSFLRNVQAVESSRVIHQTEFPLWTGPMDALDFASEAVAQHDMYVQRPSMEAEPAVVLGPTKTLLKVSKNVDVGEDRGDHLVMPADRQRPAHTTYTDDRMGFSADSLMEIENPLYISDRILGDWSQRHAYEGAPARDFRAVRGLGRPSPAAPAGAAASGAPSAMSPNPNAPTPTPSKSPVLLDESML